MSLARAFNTPRFLPPFVLAPPQACAGTPSVRLLLHAAPNAGGHLAGLTLSFEALSSARNAAATPAATLACGTPNCEAYGVDLAQRVVDGQLGTFWAGSRIIARPKVRVPAGHAHYF